MKTVVTHSGSFHADDVFAVAAFQLLLGVDQVQVIRTRDEAVITTGDYVVDVGAVYDHEARRYDHHQPGAPVRENGIPYAGFGLMWRHYGEEICGSAEVAQKIEEKLCWPIDLGDNAVEVWTNGKYDIRPFEWDGVLKAWQAESTRGEDPLEHFLMAVDVARAYLKRLILKQQIKLEQREKAVKLYTESVDKRLLVSNEYLSRSLFVEYPDTRLLVFPRSDTSDWMVAAIQQAETGFATRVRFPEVWAGLRDEELAAASGIADAKFCHKDRYMFIAKSQESVLAAARMAA